MKVSLPLPDWLSEPNLNELEPKKSKVLALAEYEMVFPRILNLIYEGQTLSDAVKQLPIEIEYGAFMAWLKKDPKRYQSYKNAKEIRTETWASDILKYAEGKTRDGRDTLEDVQRSRLKVETVKWLMSADDRKTYGEVKQLEVGGSISVTGALAAAQQRLIQSEIIDLDELEDPSNMLRLSKDTDNDDE